MSMYGPPGGPYPGQPQDPWEAQATPDADHYPSQQEWGHETPSVPQQPYRSGYDQPRGLGPGGYDAGYADPSYADPRYGDQDYGWIPPADERWTPAPPPRRGGGALVAIVVIGVLLLIAGVGSFLLYRGSAQRIANSPRASGSRPPATTPPSPSVSTPARSPGTSGSAGAGAGATPGEDARLAKVGDCLVNRGTENQPDMYKVPCGPNTYKVLRRIDGTADRTRCNGTPNLTDWYYYDHPDNSRDFVLCLRKQ